MRRRNPSYMLEPSKSSCCVPEARVLLFLNISMLKRKGPIEMKVWRNIKGIGLYNTHYQMCRARK